MSGDKFDFAVASSLVQAVESAASTLDVKNGQMEQKFGNLREGFKDSGYGKADARCCKAYFRIR